MTAEIQKDEVGETKKSPAPINKKMVIFGVVALVIIYFLTNTNNEAPVQSAATNTPTTEKKSVDNIDGSASMAATDQKVRALQQEVSQLKSKIEEERNFRKQDSVEQLAHIDKSMEGVNGQLSTLAQQIADSNAISMDKNYADRTIPLKSDKSLDGISDFTLGDQKPEGQQPSINSMVSEQKPLNSAYFGDDYLVNPNERRNKVPVPVPANSVKTENPIVKLATAGTEEWEAAFGQKDGTPKSSNDQNPPDDTKNQQEEISSKKNLVSTEEKKIKEPEYVIPAFSFMELTTIHGVACPVGGEAAGSQSSIPAKPIIMPANGLIRGPNGFQKDLGTVHLYGLCSASVISNSEGRAEIRIQSMSYWDSKGVAHEVKVTGYVQDMSDNEMNIRGKINKVSRLAMANQAVAAAAIAMSTSLSQQQFTQKLSSGQGVDQAFTGDSGKAMLGSGASALFKLQADRWTSLSAAYVDTVGVKPGIRIRFFNDVQFSVVQPSPKIEDVSELYKDIII